LSGPVTFDEAPAPGSVNFGVGQPSADLLPVGLVRAASEAFFAVAQPLEFNYGVKQGDARFRASLAAFLSRAYGQNVEADALFLSAGNSQALDFVCERFTEPGDVVFVEEPSYFLAHQIFRDYGLDIVGVPVDGQGMDMDAFEAALARCRPRLVYTIPSYHNPTGQVLSAERRARLARLSREHGFVVAADEVYQLLYCGESPPPPLAKWAGKGNILSLGSFSKILAPGMRLGWIQTNPELMKVLLASGFVTSGGSLNHFTSHIVRHAIDAGLLEPFVDQLRASYEARIDAMDQALQRHLHGLAQWTRPGGGYFFWLTLPEGVDTTALQSAALRAGTGFHPGAAFSCRGGQRNRLRLSFAHYPEAVIHEGIERLAGVLHTAL